MRTIHKYALTQHTTLQLPIDSEILCVKEQRGQVCMWTLADLSSGLTETRVFALYGTGYTISDRLKYIDTVILGEQQDLVLHVFEVIENE